MALRLLWSQPAPKQTEAFACTSTTLHRNAASQVQFTRFVAEFAAQIPPESLPAIPEDTQLGAFCSLHRTLVRSGPLGYNAAIAMITMNSSLPGDRGATKRGGRQMSDSQQDTAQPSAGKARPSPMAERLRTVKDLAAASAAGARATAESIAMMAASEAEMTAQSAGEASGELAQSLGSAVSSAVLGAAQATGALVGGLKGTAGGLVLAAQIGGAAAGEAARSATGSTVKAAGKAAEGFLLALEDQEQGAGQVQQAAKELAQGVFDATAGAALGAMGSLATAAGAVAGGARGTAGGAAQGLSRVADASAEATWAVSKEASKGGAEALRRVLRRDEEEA